MKLNVTAYGLLRWLRKLCVTRCACREPPTVWHRLTPEQYAVSNCAEARHWWRRDARRQRETESANKDRQIIILHLNLINSEEWSALHRLHTNMAADSSAWDTATVSKAWCRVKYSEPPQLLLVSRREQMRSDLKVSLRGFRPYVTAVRLVIATLHYWAALVNVRTNYHYIFEIIIRFFAPLFWSEKWQNWWRACIDDFLGNGRIGEYSEMNRNANKTRRPAHVHRAVIQRTSK